MGAFRLRICWGRFFSPTAGLFGASVLAFVVVSPLPAEARFLNAQLEAHAACDAGLPGANVFRSVGPCLGKKDNFGKAESPAISGKLGAVLAAELYCRLGTDMSALTDTSRPYLPPASPHRVIEADLASAVEWLGSGLAPDLRMQKPQGFLVAHRPDG